MNLIVKNTFKNILGKPLRSILVLFSIFVCSIAAMFCFDLSATEKGLVQGLFRSVIGDTDISCGGVGVDLANLPEDFPEYDVVSVRQFSDYLYEPIPGEYYISRAKDATISGVDLAAAARMGLIGEFTLNDNEAIITDEFAMNYGVDVGDTFSVHDVRDGLVDLVVAQIVPAKSMNLLLGGNSAVVNENTVEILSCGNPTPRLYMFSINDSSRISDAEEMLKYTFPNASIQNFANNETIDRMLDQIMGVLFLVFAIAFLLVIFITASICERIVSERMSYIGTLRSLGLSAAATARILLLENVFYAILGSIPAVILYALLRDPMYGVVLSTASTLGFDSDISYPKLSVFLMIGVVLGAILIECIIPLKAQIKALHVSIRDIIFDNRDTAYRFSRFGTAVGCVMLVSAVITFFFRSNMYVAVACLVSAVLALSFLFPRLLVLLTNILKNAASKADQEKWALAAAEAGTRKSAVGSSVLCVTSTAMCVIVFTIATSFMSSLANVAYNCDVIANTVKKVDYYSYVNFLDGVTDTEFVYRQNDTARVLGNTEVVYFYGVPEDGFRMYSGFTGIPEHLEDGTVCVDSTWADSLGLSVGDSVTVTYDPDGVIPIEKTYTVAALVKAVQSSDGGTVMLLSLNDFRDIFHDKPGFLLINSEDPSATAEALKTYGVETFGEIMTLDQLVDQQKKSNASNMRIMITVIIVAVAMSCIGIISNQLIGFEGRKKECAVMLSTSMSKKTLTGILFREMIITSLISTITGTAVGCILLFVIQSAFASSPSLSMTLNFNPLMILGLFVVMSAVFALTVLFPINSLRKMKIAEQIKYE